MNAEPSLKPTGDAETPIGSALVERLRRPPARSGEGGCQNCDDALKEEAADCIAAMAAALKGYLWGQPTTLKAGASRIEQRRFRLDQQARAALSKANRA